MQHTCALVLGCNRLTSSTATLETKISMVILVPITKKILFSHKICILHLLTIHGQQQEPVKLPPMKKEQTHQGVVVPSLLITSSLEKETGSPDEGTIFLSEEYFQ